MRIALCFSSFSRLDQIGRVLQHSIIGGCALVDRLNNSDVNDSLRSLAGLLIPSARTEQPLALRDVSNSEFSPSDCRLPAREVTERFSRRHFEFLTFVFTRLLVHPVPHRGAGTGAYEMGKNRCMRKSMCLTNVTGKFDQFPDYKKEQCFLRETFFDLYFEERSYRHRS